MMYLCAVQFAMVMTSRCTHCSSIFTHIKISIIAYNLQNETIYYYCLLDRCEYTDLFLSVRSRNNRKR